MTPTPPSPSQQIAELQAKLWMKELEGRRREEELGQTRKLVEEQRRVIERLEQRVADLEMRVRRDSTTSSEPPSTDKPWDKEARRKARNKRKAEAKDGGKKRGGASKGHKGHRRSVVEPDEIIQHAPSECARCGGSLESKEGRGAGRRQVTELSPLEPKVTEHRLCSKRCGGCGHRTYGEYPCEVRSTGSFGPRLRALMALLRGAYGLSLRKVRQFLWEVFGLRVSHGALSANEAYVSGFLKGHYEVLDQWLSEGPRLHVDETPWFEANVLHWLWVKSDGKARCFKVQRRRNAEAAMGFLAGFAGLLTTDELASYNGYDERKRQLCMAHLHRRVRGLALHPAMKGWAEAVDKAFEAMFEVWQRIRDGTEPFDERRLLMDEPQRHLRGLFEQGQSHEHKRVRGICRRVLKKWKLWWRFVVVGAEPTNNEAERSLRPAVQMRKMSHGSRSDRGSRFFERTMTVVTTLRGYGHDVFDFLARTLERGAAGRPLPWIPLGA